MKFFIWFTDRMKEAMVAKISHQCSDLYSDAMKLMQLASLKDLWPKVRMHIISTIVCLNFRHTDFVINIKN